MNLPEHRLYYYPPVKKGEAQRVYTWPISIGKMDWRTPLGTTRITEMRKNPTWTPPVSVRRNSRSGTGRRGRRRPARWAVIESVC